MKLTPEQQEFLWNKFVHNRSFDIAQELHYLREMFFMLGNGKLGTFDRWTVAERQIRVCELELDNLKKTIAAIRFKPEETIQTNEPTQHTD